MKFNVATALLIAAFAVAAPSQASVAHLTLTATPGDFISGGKSVDNIYSSNDPQLVWKFANFNNIGTATAPATNYISFVYLLNPSANVDDEFATLDFSSRMLGTDLKAGTTYLNAERAAFASAGHAGLAVSYDHRGCNTLRGSFTVDQLTFKAGAIDTFGASFSQSCDGGPFMNGTFYYNAELTELPTNKVPEPASLVLLGLGMVGVGLARRRKKAQ